MAPPHHRTLADEHSLKLSIANATVNWGDLEDTLAVLLDGILKGAVPQIGLAIYFAPANTETRFYIVDSAVRHVLRGSVDLLGNVTRMRLADELLICWQKILDKLNRAKETRNSIVHSTISRWKARTKYHYRLTSSIKDIGRLTRQLNPRQLPGMSRNDVEQAAKNFHVVSETVKMFSMIVRDIRMLNYEPAFEDRVRALAIHLRTSVESLGVHFPREPQPPRAPSPASRKRKRGDR